MNLLTWAGVIFSPISLSAPSSNFMSDPSDKRIESFEGLGSVDLANIADLS